MPRLFFLLALASLGCSGGNGNDPARVGQGSPDASSDTNGSSTDALGADDALDATHDIGTICTNPGACSLELGIPPTGLDGTDTSPAPSEITICPAGPLPAANPITCVAVMSLGSAVWTSTSAGHATLTVGVAIANLDVEGDEYTLSADPSECPSDVPGSVTPAQLTFTIEGEFPSSARPGCDAIDVTAVTLDSSTIPVHECPEEMPINLDSSLQPILADGLSQALMANLNQRTCLR